MNKRRGVAADKERFFKMPFNQFYLLLAQKAERKGRAQEEVDAIIFRLTGYDEAGLQARFDAKVDPRTFREQAPRINEKAALIKGNVGNIRVENTGDPLPQNIRRLEKLVNELALDRALDRILGR